MGVFLAGPLAAELRAAPGAEAPLPAARRILEVLVPLVYRPAVKVPGPRVSSSSLRSSPPAASTPA
jgi:hypothetical protein